MWKAALDAGYTESMAKNATHRILPGAIAEFQAVLSRKIPISKLIQRIAEGLDATEVKLLSFNGRFTAGKLLTDFEVRRRYIELVCRLKGYLKERVELSTEDNAHLTINLQVNFVDPEEPEAAPKKLLERCDEQANELVDIRESGETQP
jgi:hypothetical protein